MAHSIQEFDGRIIIVNDLDLIVIVGLVLKLVSTVPNPNLSQALVESWKRIPSSYGPGIIDLELASLIRSPEEKAIFLNLLHQIERGLSDYGDVIPAPVLNDLITVPGLKFSDYKIHLIMAALNSLKKLLTQ